MIDSVRHRDRFFSSARAACVLAALLFTAAACDDGPTTPGRITSGGSTTTANVSGNWSGGANDSTRQFQLTLRLTQSGTAVSGTMSATTAVGAPVFSNGTVTGTVSGSTFTFTMTVPAGGISDAPDCVASFAAVTSDLLATSMAGTYTGTDTCGGTFAGGRFQLLKE